MRICMLLDREGWRADGRVRRELRALHAAGHDVVLLHRGAADTDPRLGADGGRTLTVLPRRGRAFLERVPSPLRRLLVTACFAWRAVRMRPDAIHAHDLPMLLPGWIAARLVGAAVVFDSHEYQLGLVYHGRIARLVVRALQRVLVPRCDTVIAVSEDTAAALRRRYGGEPVVVRNVPETGWAARGVRIADLRSELGIGSAPLLLAQGAIGAGRGAFELVDAFGGLEDAHAVFMGDADPGWDAAVRERAAAAGNGARVHVIGSVPLEVLLEHTRQADLGFVLIDPRWANHRMTLPNKLFEYLVAGVPVVASAGTASARLVTGLGVGWAVPYGDAAVLARVLSAALAARGDPGLRERLATAGRAFTWERERGRLLELYAAPAAATSDATRSGGALSSSIPNSSE